MDQMKKMEQRHQQETGDLLRQLMESKKKAEERENEMKEEIESLKKIIDNLQNRFGKSKVFTVLLNNDS